MHKISLQQRGDGTFCSEDARPKRLKTYLFHYRYEGVEFCTDVPAYSLDEARGRLKAMPLAQYDGELVMTIPAVTGPWLPRLICRIRNLFTGDTK